MTVFLVCAIQTWKMKFRTTETSQKKPQCAAQGFDRRHKIKTLRYYEEKMAISTDFKANPRFEEKFTQDTKQENVPSK